LTSEYISPTIDSLSLWAFISSTLGKRYSRTSFEALLEGPWNTQFLIGVILCSVIHELLSLDPWTSSIPDYKVSQTRDLPSMRKYRTLDFSKRDQEFFLFSATNGL
jgi:hypothetical protein